MMLSTYSDMIELKDRKIQGTLVPTDLEDGVSKSLSLLSSSGTEYRVFYHPNMNKKLRSHVWDDVRVTGDVLRSGRQFYLRIKDFKVTRKAPAPLSQPAIDFGATAPALA